jgi:hypothetical protein
MKTFAYIMSAASVAVLALSTSSIHAQSTNPVLSAYAGTDVTMTVEPYASGENNGQDYVGLTTVDVSAYGTTESFEAFCDDFNHDIVPPATYSAVVEAISGTTMEQEAYYGMEFGSQPSGNTSMDTALQELIWNYTAPASSQFAMTPEMESLQANMLANYASVNYDNSVYLNAGNNGQSFMITEPAPAVTSVAPTPEPPTLITLATGLIGMAGFIRRRALARQS